MRVLIIGPLNGYGSTAVKIAMNRGAKVTQADSVDLALSIIRSGQGADLIMIDVTLDIATFIRSLREERIHATVVSCGITEDPDQAANSIRAGAKEYIPLPPDPELISAVFEAICDEEMSFIYRDPAMETLIKFANKIAPSQANVLITGESGTGKEVLANHIHKKSKRKNQPFISINCAAIPENLLESELFGHEKGAFTGAIARRIGKFEEANGGTLLLDEISEMHPRLQAKLLRAIQEREIDRVGGTKPIKVDIRIIATSNRDLAKSIEEKEFREDLYFRLNVINLQIPPLRRRPKDIEALVKHFAEKYTKANQMSSKKVSQAALQHLLSQPWRGNVRELENCIHRSVFLAQGSSITPEDIMLPNVLQGGRTENTMGDLVGRTVSAVEQDLIINTLNHCLGNRTHAANILGISIRTLRNKIKEYSSTGAKIPESGNRTEMIAG